MDPKLRKLWALVLDIDDTDLDEDTNFFETGGDSVTALRLVAAAQATQVSLDIEDIFNYPTLGELAKNCQEGSHLSKTQDPANESSVLDQDTLEACATACQVERNAIEDIFPASGFQERIFEAGRSYGTYMAQWIFQNLWGLGPEPTDRGLGSTPKEESNPSDQARQERGRPSPSRVKVRDGMARR